MDKKSFFVLAFFFLLIQQLCAQIGDSSLLKRAVIGVTNQLTIYPQEKIHLHLDRAAYYPGDSIRFHVYMVHSTFHTPIHISRYIYIELINPFNEVVSMAKIRDSDTTIMMGYLSLRNDMAAGNYLLRAYTAYMASENPAYLFSRSIKIISPALETFDIRTEKIPTHGTSALSLQLLDQYSNATIKPKLATATLSSKSKASIPIIGDKLKISIRPSEVDQNAAMLLDVMDVNNNSFRKFIPLVSDKTDFSVAFYPEGGYLIEGVRCRVGFQVNNGRGHDKEVIVEVLDETKKVIVQSRTTYSGLGSFTFEPQTGHTYLVRCKDKFGTVREMKLPSAIPNGIGIGIQTTDSTFIVSLKAAASIDNDKLYLLAHVRGAVVYFAPFKIGRKNYIFDRRLFPSGIVQFLLLDSGFNPLSERLTFSNREEDKTLAKLSFQRDFYKVRDKVEVSVSLKGSNGGPLKGIFSAAVTDQGFGVADTANSILSTLLLTSDLPGTIENPIFYLGKDKKAKEALDLLLLIHGWRRYSLPNILNDRIVSPKTKPEQFMKISGKVKSVSVFDWGKDYRVRINGTNNGYKKDAKTDKNREFVFDSLEYVDGAGFNISAVKKGEYFPKGDRYIDLNKIKEVQIENNVLQDPLIDYEELTVDTLKDLPLVTRREHDFLIRPVQVNASYWGNTEYIRFNLKQVGRLPYHDMTGLLKHMGLRISTDFIYYKKQRVAVFVDGMPVTLHENVLYEMTLADLDEIVFLPFVRAATLNRLAGFQMGKRQGLQGVFGLYPKEEGMPSLNIVTRNGFDTRNFGERYIPRVSSYAPRSTVFPAGYQSPVEFYHPTYDTQERKLDGSVDERETVYWNPKLKSDIDGKINFSFYTTDRHGTYTIILEGISENGEIVREVKNLVVLKEK
ncbi:hypothetical protein [Sphingobacterium siyangense]|jgi:hypothetical protein|uniref:hypothetical protein n=1 Tax=Sphingobacterium siyangense TaxID=459529 RepID=UPI003C734DCE